MSFQDGGLVSVTPRGNIMFAREEGLAKVQKSEFVNMGFEEWIYYIRGYYDRGKIVVNLAC